MGNRLATIDMGRKRGWAVVPLMWGGAGSPSNNVDWAKAYLLTKWHLDPSNGLATIYQRYRQTGQRSRSIGEPLLVKVRPKAENSIAVHWFPHPCDKTNFLAHAHFLTDLYAISHFTYLISVIIASYCSHLSCMVNCTDFCNVLLLEIGSMFVIV